MQVSGTRRLVPVSGKSFLSVCRRLLVITHRKAPMILHSSYHVLLCSDYNVLLLRITKPKSQKCKQNKNIKNHTELNTKIDIQFGPVCRLTDDPPQSRSAPGRSAPRPPQTLSIRPNFWDDPPLVLGRSAPIKLHQILTEVDINDDTPWTIAVG